MSSKSIVHLYAALAVAVVSGSSAAVIFKLTSAPASVAAGYRLLIAVLLMTPFIIWKYRHEFKGFSTREWLLSVGSGLFLALHFTFWFESLQYTSVASSVVLVSMQPIFTFIGASLFLKEKLSRLSFVGMLIAMLGSMIIFRHDLLLGDLVAFGNLLALLAALMMSVYLLLGQYLRKNLSFMSYTYVVYSISMLFIFAYLLMTGQTIVGYSLKDWYLFVLLALIPTLMGHSIFNWLMKWISASVISISSLFQPISASLLAYIFLKEAVSVSQFAGGSVILIGVYLFLKGKSNS